MSKPIFDNPTVRKQCFDEFLVNKLDKQPVQLTKDDLLSLSYKDFTNPEINQTSVGRAASLYSWFIKQKLNEPILFSILNDTGYAKSHFISKEDVENSISKKHSDSKDIFPNKQNRLTCFNDLLKNKFKKDLSELTKDDLLSLSYKDFNNPEINQTSVASAVSLYNWFAKKKLNEPIIFSILNDTGYANLYDITIDNIIDSANSKRTAHNKSNQKEIIIQNPRVISDKNHANIIFEKYPSDIKKTQKNDTTQIQIVMSTETKIATLKEIEIKTNELQKPLINQILEVLYPQIKTITSERNFLNNISEMQGSFIMKSLYPLDMIYMSGLEKSGFEIVESNMKLSTNTKEYNRLLKPYYISHITRIGIPIEKVDNLYFENHLYPMRIMLNYAGFFSRMIARADSMDSVYSCIKQSFEWFERIENEKILDLDTYNKVLDDFQSNILKVSQNRMAQLYKNDITDDMKIKHDSFVSKLKTKKLGFIKTVQKAKMRQALVK